MVTIDLFADIACPWCYIGERRLRRVLDERGLEARVRWRPFELQRNLPPGGIRWEELVERKFGGWERARAMFAHVQRAGDEEGIRFDFERVASAPNTRDAHRLMLLAGEHGKTWEMAEALFSAYFTQGRDVGDRQVLAELAASVGLDAERVRQVLEGGDYIAEVQASLEVADRSGIGGVPLFVFDGRFGVSGAQPAEVLHAALDRAEGKAA
ncbi:MAG TPA: DsbA family oxidoreductase [Longimicrobium sp.]|jgi:predicted DsbA family dithiol-disulfide isomerase